MKFSWSVNGFKDYQRLPKILQDQVDKQIALLLFDLRYPSLRAKKYDEGRDIWQARVTRGWRFISGLSATLTRFWPSLSIRIDMPEQWLKIWMR